MATKKKTTSRRKKKPAKDTVTEQEVSGRIVIDVPEDLGAYYVSHAEISHNKHDFTILCGKLPAKLSPEQLAIAKSSGEVHIETLVQLIVPPTMIAGLIYALTEQKRKYEKETGKSLDDPAFPTIPGGSESHDQRRH
jgi:hypothetical protein